MILDIGDKHMPRGVGDHNFGLYLHGYCLWGNTAGPKYWGFALADGNGLSEIGLVDIGDTDSFGGADVDRAAVDTGESACYLYSLDDLMMGDWPHTTYHRPRKGSCIGAGDIGDVHRYIAAFLDVPYGDALG